MVRLAKRWCKGMRTHLDHSTYVNKRPTRACNPSTGEAEAGRSLGLASQLVHMNH